MQWAPTLYVILLTYDFYIYFFNYRVITLKVKKSTSSVATTITTTIISLNIKFYFYSYLTIFISSKLLTSSTPIFLVGYTAVLLVIWAILLYRSMLYSLLINTNLFWILVVFVISSNLILVYTVISNMLSFLLVLEVISVLYYFFLLSSTSISDLSIIKYKHLLLLYLVSSVITTLFFFISFFFFYFSYGTIHFYELSILPNVTFMAEFLLIVSILWKLGVPGFHFFKLEIYQYLSVSIVILFSIFSLILGSSLLIFIMYKLYFRLVVVLKAVVGGVILSACLLLSVGLRYTTLNQFIAYSTLSTTVIVLLSCVYFSVKFWEL